MKTVRVSMLLYKGSVLGLGRQASRSWLVRRYGESASGAAGSSTASAIATVSSS